MVRVLAILLALWPTLAQAEIGAIVCLFVPTKERFNLISKGSTDYIQWSGGEFVAVQTEFDGQYLIIAQYADTATFRMVWDTKSKRGYGGLVDYNGNELKGDIVCTVQ